MRISFGYYKKFLKGGFSDEKTNWTCQKTHCSRSLLYYRSWIWSRHILLGLKGGLSNEKTKQ